MTLQASGAISLLDIAGEFSGIAPHALSEYYRSPNGLTSDNNTGVPLSGAIDFSDFYGTTFVARGEQVYGAGTHTWTVPAGVTSVCVYALSGGSAGRTSGSGSGGSGGSYAYLNNHAVTPGEDIEVVVGAGGIAPSGGGGVSTFRDATTLRAAYFSTVGTSNGNGGTGGTGTSFSRPYSDSSRAISTVSINQLDTPNTTSSTSYTIRIRATSAGAVQFISQATEAYIQLMEISA